MIEGEMGTFFPPSHEQDAWHPIVPVTFTKDELLYLHSCVRIDLPGLEQWRYPPCSKELNDQVVDAIVVCTDNDDIREYTLQLNYWDLAAIDGTARWSDASPGGAKVGQSVLMKTFRARRLLAGDLPANGKEQPPAHSFDELEAHFAKKPRRRAPRIDS